MFIIPEHFPFSLTGFLSIVPLLTFIQRLENANSKKRPQSLSTEHLTQSHVQKYYILSCSSVYNSVWYYKRRLLIRSRHWNKTQQPQLLSYITASKMLQDILRDKLKKRQICICRHVLFTIACQNLEICINLFIFADSWYINIYSAVYYIRQNAVSECLTKKMLRNFSQRMICGQSGIIWWMEPGLD